MESTIFCCHGGLSPDLQDFDQVISIYAETAPLNNNLKRRTESLMYASSRATVLAKCVDWIDIKFSQISKSLIADYYD